MLKKSDKPECDISYDFCDYVSGKFMKSEEYRNTRHSTYEMLEQWIGEHEKKQAQGVGKDDGFDR